MAENNVTEIWKCKPVVYARYCPACGFYLPQLIIRNAVADFTCAGCEQTHLSDYLPVLRYPENKNARRNK